MLETSRVALICYDGPDGQPCVASGLLLDDWRVLTADHAADGTRHRVVLSGPEIPVTAILRTGDPLVDLAVFTLSAPVPVTGQPLSCGQVERGRAGQVTGCVAIGFPRWMKRGGRRLTAQVQGWVPTGEGLDRLADAGLRVGFLTLVGDRNPAAKPIQADLADRPESPWGGMSGAGVVVGDVLIGVVRSHNLAAGGQSLTVTPLTAIESLPGDLRQRFRDALGITGPGLSMIRPTPVVHADLAALFAYQNAADEDRFAALTSQLAQALDRLPPSPAEQGDVAVYLAMLIRWLNTDPWPQDKRFGGPLLTPAAVERKLRIISDHNLDKHDLDADDLGRQCARLVVLGGPGSGKTWLARRTARLCAEGALQALAAGAGLDEVELPLFTTCARLAATPSSDEIRRAVVSSALGQLPDLGGSRVSDALRVLLERRKSPTLLVADSLDEALGADERIRQADSLQGWRIVLTSRPASWNGQLAVSEDDPLRQVGTLQPLRYPDDVEPFIVGWFAGRPAWAAALAAQLRDRPVLQQPATVPLILAFYCIVGGDQPLPSRRADLYIKVIRRMLSGWWRGHGNRDPDPDPDACLETLRDWAWSAAASNPVSGIGIWSDEFLTPRVRQPPDDRDAMDHVAVPLGPPDSDTWMRLRRFVHRAIREHLVAEHVAFRMSAEGAAAELLNHLWYDPDWEYAAAAALAMHPQGHVPRDGV